MGTTSLKYFRLDSSPYQKSNFLEEEGRMFNDLGLQKANSPFDSEILISNTHTDFSKLPLEKLSKVELFLHPNSGYDNFPADYVKKAPFPIITGNSIRAHGVTEFILSKVFQHFSALENAREWDATRSWKRKLLRDSNVYLIGYGHIGTLLEQSLRPLVKKIIIHDPFKGLDFKDPEGSDIVLLASSLNKTSERIIDKEFLERLSPAWLLINAARGRLINENALIQALKSQPSSTAFLDVFESEPCDFKAYEKIPNLIKSSHVAGVSDNLDQLIIDFERDCTTKFLTHRSNLSIFESYFKELLLRNKLAADISFLI